MAEPKGDKPFQDFKLAESTKIVETAEPEACTAMAVVSASGKDAKAPSDKDSASSASASSSGDANFTHTSDSGSNGSGESDVQLAQASLWHDAESRGTFVPPPYKGLKRHRLVVASCALLALSILALSTTNLKPLIKTTGTIDSNLRVTKEFEKPKLSPDLVYPSDAVLKDGMIRVTENKWGSSKCGFVDAKGKIAIAPQFFNASDFDDGLAIVWIESKEDTAVAAKVETKTKKEAEPGYLYGVIDKTGKEVVKPKYSIIHPFNKGVALAALDDETFLIDKTGKVLFSTASLVVPKNKEVPSEAAALSDFDENELLVDGQLMINYFNSNEASFVGDLIPFSLSNSQHGLLDTAGRVVAQPIYNRIFLASDDVNLGHLNLVPRNTENSQTSSAFLVLKDGKWGALDPSGKELFPPMFGRILSYQNDHAAVMVGDKYGFADAKGNIVIKPEYDFVTAFDKIIAVKKGKVWSFIDSTGKPITTPPIDGIVHSGRGVWLSDGLGQVVKGNKVGFLNAAGQFALKPQFEWAFAFANGIAPVYTNGFWHYINSSGKQVSPDFVAANALVNGRSSVSVPGPLFPFLKLTEGYEIEHRIKEWHNVIAGRKADDDGDTEDSVSKANEQ
ncbi:hypothetical protein BH11CYA1_BH11CYA1_09070 [soil metagenome]